METKPLIFTDRSRIVQGWKCPRARYWQYHYKGRGIISGTTSLELMLGLTVHDALAAIATQHKAGQPVDIDLIASAANKQMMEVLLENTTGEVDAVNFANEQSALVEGLVRGFYRHVWPQLMSSYKGIIAIEEEVQYSLDDTITFMARPDLILEDHEGNWHYLEYKTTSSKTDKWINSWATAVQLHSSVKAVEQTLGIAPTSVQVIGLYKGYESYGKQNSPFCYTYVRQGNPPFTETQTHYEYKAGFKRSPTWELSGGVKKWVEEMPEDVLANQFPMCPPIFVKDDLVNAFFQQQMMREHEISLALQMMEHLGAESVEGVMNMAFPQHFEQCSPAWGHGCQYKRLCHGHYNDPLEEGYLLRTAHHSPEEAQHNAAKGVNENI